MPASQPRPEQFEALVARKPEGSLYMLNLLKFKPKAEYADGRETDLTGEQAYGIYGAAVSKIIDEMGGGLIWGGKANVLLIGDGDLEWDTVGIMRYPSFESFTGMTQSEAYQKIHVHRDAGLAHQVLINCLDGEQAMSAFTSANS
jgi:uncharacterized protein (DUF1330 family)